MDRHTFPNGGWQFRQPQTGWTAPAPGSNTFDQQVTNIIRHREKNKAVVVKHRLALDRASVETELENFNRVRLGLPLQEAPSFFRKSSSPAPSSVPGVAAEIKRAAQGTGVILDWLTSGGDPVAQDLANKRAGICVACPKNVDGAWFTVAPAELIKSTLEARKDLKLETPSDAALKSCDVCKCLMRLKVWTPLEFIVRKTRPEIMAEFPANCWIAKRDQ